MDISYRVRQVNVDAHLKTATLIMAAMIGEDGQIVPSSMERQPISRNWHELDANSQEALDKATGLIADQIKRYDRKVNAVISAAQVTATLQYGTGLRARTHRAMPASAISRAGG